MTIATAAAAAFAAPTEEVAAVADWRPFVTRHHLVAASRTGDDVLVRWSDGRESPYDALWLRDNCPCTVCVNPVTREQVFEITAVPEDLAPARLEVTPERLIVRWADGHVSPFEAGFLRVHAYDDVSRAERRRVKRPWRAERLAAIPTFAYTEVTGSDRGLLAWLAALAAEGLTKMAGVPTEPGTVGRVANLVSFMRETNFGIIFDVMTKPEADSNAYTSLQLPFHTDLPTRELQPGVQFLHCLVNDASGGESQFVDGFAVAEALRDEDPALFEILSTTPVEFRNKARRSDYRCRAPVIGLDTEGAVSEVRVANFLRAPVDLAPAAMRPFYRAYRRFSQLTTDPRFLVETRLDAGEMWTFDNRRVLHARAEFDPTSGHRHFQGCYLDRDELLSRIRVLEREVGAA
jgi:gamma-butyrobetaine dioxygenase